MKSKKPASLGTVWPVHAVLFDENGRKLGRCLDTPNAIAKAFMQCSRAAFVKPSFEMVQEREVYSDRMKSWNKAESFLTLGAI